MQSRVNRRTYLLAGAVAVALVVAGALWSWPLNTAEEWSALAGWVTAAVASIAGGVAVGQLGEARRLRLEQAQPYVVAFMDPSPAGSWYVDLVVRNFGVTAAHDVRVEIKPAPHRHAGQGGAVWLPDVIPVLVPGQEWRTFWDTGQRTESDLPDRHEAMVTFSDSQRRELPPLRSLLDWGVFENRSTIDIYGIHHAAKALRQIDKTLSRWKEPGSGRLAVVARDGDAKDTRELERRAEQAKRQADPEEQPDD